MLLRKSTFNQVSRTLASSKLGALPRGTRENMISRRTFVFWPIFAFMLVIKTVCFGNSYFEVFQSKGGQNQERKAMSAPQIKYQSSLLEEYVLENANRYSMNSTSRATMRPMCSVLGHPDSEELRNYLENLKTYNFLLKTFPPLNQDIRILLSEFGSSVCNKVLLSGGNNSNVSELFAPNQISTSSVVGALEPLIPPLRHPAFCKDRSKLMDLSYMVHDFHAMCQNLKPTARTVFVDMGASLDFHGESSVPAMYVLKLYRKFGFHFDHIYAYEVTPKEPSEVFQKVPPEFFAAYHWINVGVESDQQSVLNPLQMLADHYDEDDFIVIKLDIDTSSVEVPLAYQLLEDERIGRLVDQFYFEHHVYLKELSPYWGRAVGGSVSDSLNLFQSLRQKGIGAHSWV